MVFNFPSQTLSALLPLSFGPADLGLENGLMAPINAYDAVTQGYSLVALAWQACLNSFAPCSRSQSGVAIKTHSGKIYSGSYLETVAFNPSLSPLHAALVAVVADLHDFREISHVHLIEKTSSMISQEASTRLLLNAIAPRAAFAAERRNF